MDLAFGENAGQGKNYQSAPHCFIIHTTVFILENTCLIHKLPLANICGWHNESFRTLILHTISLFVYHQISLTLFINQIPLILCHGSYTTPWLNIHQDSCDHNRCMWLLQGREISPVIIYCTLWMKAYTYQVSWRLIVYKRFSNWNFIDGVVASEGELALVISVDCFKMQCVSNCTKYIWLWKLIRNN